MRKHRGENLVVYPLQECYVLHHTFPKISVVMLYDSLARGGRDEGERRMFIHEHTVDSYDIWEMILLNSSCESS